jgi:two-component system sensor histidine kinase TorS
MPGRSGLGGKLLLAFVVIAGLPALTALISWFELREVVDNQTRVIDVTLPALAEVHGFTEGSSRIVAAAPELATVNSDYERRQRKDFLVQQVDALGERLARYARIDRNVPERLAGTVKDVHEGINALDDVVRRRILLMDQRHRKLRSSLTATTALLDLADTLVANSEMGAVAVITNLYEIPASAVGSSQTLDTLDRLIEVDLFQLGLMFELRSRTAEIGLLLNRVPGVRSDRELAALWTDLNERGDLVRRRIDAIPDPGRVEQARALSNEILPANEPVQDPQGADVLTMTGEILALERRIDTLHARLRKSAERLDVEAAALAAAVQDRARADGGDSMSAIRTAWLLDAWSAAAALLVSLAVMWFYVRGNVTRRLDRLSRRMFQLVEGRLDPRSRWRAPTRSRGWRVRSKFSASRRWRTRGWRASGKASSASFIATATSCRIW